MSTSRKTKKGVKETKKMTAKYTEILDKEKTLNKECFDPRHNEH